MLVPTSRAYAEQREPPSDAAAVEEISEFSAHWRPFCRPKDAAPKLVAVLRLTGLLRKPLHLRGFLFRQPSPPVRAGTASTCRCTP